MDFILSALGTAGDVLPFVAMAKALKARGDRAVLLTCEPFVAVAQRNGVEAVAVLSQADYDKTLADPRLWKPNEGFVAAVQGFGMPAMDAAFQYVMQHANADTVVIGSTISFGARCAAEKKGSRYIATHLAPAIFRSNQQPPRFPGLWMPAWMPNVAKDSTWYMIDTLYYDRVVLPPLNAFRKTHGLSSVSRLLHEWIHKENATLALFPEWFAAPQADWVPGLKLSHFPLFDGGETPEVNGDLLRWIDEVGAPILFTGGSGKQESASLFQAAMAACDNLGKPGILLSSDPALAENLPSWFRVERYVPFSSLLSRMGAIVHHGGIGTLSQALRAGIPQLVMPMSHDQHDNSARVQALGVARELEPLDCHAAAISDALYELQNHSMITSRCQQVRSRFEGVNTAGVILSALDSLLV